MSNKINFSNKKNGRLAFFKTTPAETEEIAKITAKTNSTISTVVRTLFLVGLEEYHKQNDTSGSAEEN